MYATELNDMLGLSVSDAQRTSGAAKSHPISFGVAYWNFAVIGVLLNARDPGCPKMLDGYLD